MEILIICLLLLLNGVFAMYEIALVSSRKSRLQDKERDGSKGARVALALREKPEEILSAIQVGITLVGIVSGAFGGLALAEDLVPLLMRIDWLAPWAETLSVIFVVGLITYFSLIIGELVPKTIALNNPEKIAILLSPAMQTVGKVLYPAVWLLSISTNIVLRIARIRKTEDAPVTEEELRLLLKQGSEHGIIEKEESVIINEVIRFGDKFANTIMTHRVDVEFLNTESNDAEILQKLENSNHSVLPLIRKPTEEVLGIIPKKDILMAYIRQGHIDLESLVTEPLYFPEHMPAIRVLEEFRKARKHFGIVLNEYGLMEGVVTLHDVTENLLGDMPMSDEENVSDIQRLEDGSLLFSGSITIEDLQDLLDIKSLDHSNEKTLEVNTLSGYLMVILNRIPLRGDQVRVQDYLLEVIEVDGNRVALVKARKM
jgi:putative hemolysin